MPYILGNIPFFDCLVRREYTRNKIDGHGEYLPAVAHAVRCVRGNSLMFQCIFSDKFAGASFTLPIEALCWKPCDALSAQDTQPWDCFSSDFGVCEFDFLKRGAAFILPDKTSAQYRFTIDWTGSDLADHFEQHKHLHVLFADTGHIHAVPNNRVLWSDPAFWTVTKDIPDFQSLAGEYRAEGHQQMFNAQPRDGTFFADREELSQLHKIQ